MAQKELFKRRRSTCQAPNSTISKGPKHAIKHVGINLTLQRVVVYGDIVDARELAEIGRDRGEFRRDRDACEVS